MNLKPNPHTALLLAYNFVRAMRGVLSREKLAEAARRNKTPEYDLACATHDFCDANMVMFEAWENTYGASPEWDSSKTDPTEFPLWNAAWDYARTAGFDRHAVPAMPDLFDCDLVTISTGGGCEAVAHTFKRSRSYLLVTDGDYNAYRAGSEWIVGVYKDGEGGEGFVSICSDRRVDNVTTRRYHREWFAPMYDATTDECGAGEFTNLNGYDLDDTVELLALEVGEKWTAHEPFIGHVVTRIA